MKIKHVKQAGIKILLEINQIVTIINLRIQIIAKSRARNPGAMTFVVLNRDTCMWRQGSLWLNQPVSS